MPKYFSEKGQELITKSLGQCQINPFSGSLNYVIPLTLTSARGLEPSLSLSFHPSTQNSIIGLGGDLSFPSISRSTQFFIPYYDNERDIFTSDWGELVSCAPPKKNHSHAGKSWTVRYYQARQEASFVQFEYWESETESETVLKDSYWLAKTGQGINHIFGQSKDGQVFDTNNPNRVFRWRIEETYDAKGNRIVYTYEKAPGESQSYLTKIAYGNYPNDPNTFAFNVILDYGELGLSAFSEQDLQQPKAQSVYLRSDPLTSYAAGFLIKTTRLCRNILLTHFFENKKFLVSGWELSYRPFDSESAKYLCLSQVQSVQQHGYKKLITGKILQKSLPPIHITYIDSGLNWENNFDSGNTLHLSKEPGLKANLLHFRFVDLYQEGLPGILYSDDMTTLFWRNRGKGIFEPPVLPSPFPIERNLNSTDCQLMTFPESEHIAFVVSKQERGGFYTYKPGKGWQNYQPFEKYTADFTNPNAAFFDVDGRGYSDIAILNRTAPFYYSSLGEKGFGPQQPMHLKPVNSKKPFNFPTNQFTSGQELVTFANLLGDGLQHRVKITQDTIEYWPNLGHGCFGDKVTITQSPKFGNNFDARCLFLANINGIGGVDLIYVRSKTVNIYFNLQGHAFTQKPVVINLPDMYTHSDEIHFVDLFGKGIPSLVFTKLTPKGCQYYYYDFAPTQLPYLLQKIENNIGLEITIEYTTSVQCYSDDLKNGRTPKYKCITPTTVVKQIEYRDCITGLKLTERYQFHDGYYDPVERNFVGFGFVEHWDSNEVPVKDFENAGAEDDALYAPINYTKSWYHCGALSTYSDSASDPHILTDFDTQNYFHADKEAWSPLEDSQLYDKNNNPLIFEANSKESLRQARYALRGQLLQEEIYGIATGKNDTELNTIPYSVTTHNYTLRCLKTADNQSKGIFTVLDRESLTYHYERNLADPRIQHQLNLVWDFYNHVLTSCTIYYPRRGPIASLPEPGKPDTRTYERASTDVYPQQKKIRIIATIVTMQNTGTTSDCRFQFLGYITEESIFDIPPNNNLLENSEFPFFGKTLASFNAVKQLLSLRSQADKDVMTRKLYHYWDNLPLPLLKYIETLVETEEALIQTYCQRPLTQLTPELLTDLLQKEAGYVLKNSSWWRPGPVTVYADQNGFYLPLMTASWAPDLNHPDITVPWYSKSEISYDVYYLVTNTESHYLYDKASRKLKRILVMHVDKIDYYVCAPRVLHDANQTFSEVLYDPLGVVVASSVYGKVNNTKMGNLLLPDNLLKKPFDDPQNYSSGYLAQAGQVLMYQVYTPAPSHNPENISPKPAALFHFSRTEYQNNIAFLGSPYSSATQISVEYHDGFGSIIQTKTKSTSDASITAPWITSGYTIRNNKGLVVKAYLPYYSSTMDYKKADLETLPPPETRYYDALDRVLRIHTPKGYYSKIIYNAWYEWHFDKNDTYKHSPYYKGLVQKESPEQAILDQSTPTDAPHVHLFDTLSKVFIKMNIMKMHSQDEQPLLFSSVISYDALGRKLTQKDPRLLKPNVTIIYDKQGNALVEDSVDFDERIQLYQQNKKIIRQWNSRHYTFQFTYDNWQRLVSKRVTGGEKNIDYVYETIRYGDLENEEIAIKNNWYGKVIQHNDQAGISRFSTFDIDNHSIKIEREIFLSQGLVDFDWKTINENTLPKSQSFVQEVRFDALNKMIQLRQVDGSLYFFEYNQAEQLNAIALLPQDTPILKRIINHIDYAANGKKNAIHYGNGMKTDYEYELTTQYLNALTTKRSSGQKIQEIIYNQRDPMGNILQINDHSYELLFSSPSSLPPANALYDSLTRLKSADRRSMPLTLFSQPKKMPHISTTDLKNNLANLEIDTESFNYDSGNNMIWQARIKKMTGAKIEATKFTINPDSDRLKEVNTTGNTPEDFKVHYDLQGNMQKSDDNTTLTWNYLNQLAQVNKKLTDGGTLDEFYYYAASSQRLRKLTIERDTNKITRIVETLYLKNYEIKREIDPSSWTSSPNPENWTPRSTSTALRIHDGRQRIASYFTTSSTLMPPGLIYHLTDHLNSITIEVDEQTNLLTYEEFSSFGKTLFIVSQNEQLAEGKAYRYSHEEYDPNTGFYYYGARYYSPELGRWLSSDPGGYIDGLDLFRFVRNNPLNFWDYFGLMFSIGSGSADSSLPPIGSIRIFEPNEFHNGTPRPNFAGPTRVTEEHLGNGKWRRTEISLAIIPVSTAGRSTANVSNTIYNSDDRSNGLLHGLDRGHGAPLSSGAPNMEEIMFAQATPSNRDVNYNEPTYFDQLDHRPLEMVTQALATKVMRVRTEAQARSLMNPGNTFTIGKRGGHGFNVTIHDDYGNRIGNEYNSSSAPTPSDAAVHYGNPTFMLFSNTRFEYNASADNPRATADPDRTRTTVSVQRVSDGSLIAQSEPVLQHWNNSVLEAMAISSDQRLKQVQAARRKGQHSFAYAEINPENITNNKRRKLLHPPAKSDPT